MLKDNDLSHLLVAYLNQIPNQNNQGKEVGGNCSEIEFENIWTSKKMSRPNSYDISFKRNPKWEEEQDFGNTEYKLFVHTKSSLSIEKLESQLRYRLNEGNGECIFVLGITDSGTLVGLSQKEFDESKEILYKICVKNHYSVTELRQVNLEHDRCVYEFLIREVDNNKYLNVKVAIAGNVDSGKSTTLGCLISGKNDDGDGSCRTEVFNFRHEIVSGRTSSISQRILGFDENGNVVNYKNGRQQSWPEIVKDSTKIISFFDLCGHLKYIHTTILGLTSQSPDLVIITVGSNMGISRITREHIFLSVILKIPFIILITKMDLVEDKKEVLESTVSDLKKILKVPAVNRVMYNVNSKEDVAFTVQQMNKECIIPAFYTCNKTGKGLDLLQHFLNLYHSSHERKDKDGVELRIDSIFNVKGVGCVVGGQLLSGIIRVNDKLMLGPYNNRYETVTVRSIHCKRVNVSSVESGNYVCCAIKKPDELRIKKGQVLLSLSKEPYQIREFKANIYVMKSHSSTIKDGYTPIVNVGNIRQAAKITSIEGTKQILKTNDEGTVNFKFIHHPAFVKEGQKIILTEGLVKIFGTITNVIKEKVTLLN